MLIFAHLNSPYYSLSNKLHITQVNQTLSNRKKHGKALFPKKINPFCAQAKNRQPVADWRPTNCKFSSAGSQTSACRSFCKDELKAKYSVN
jgi:hypothetical protein